jgi:hypothetical protein
VANDAPTARELGEWIVSEAGSPVCPERVAVALCRIGPAPHEEARPPRRGKGRIHNVSTVIHGRRCARQQAKVAEQVDMPKVQLTQESGTVQCIVVRASP